jgi:6-hydroxynicotinate 3-monooxygenase
MLQRAGYDVKLYEQTTRIERIGAGINLSPNVMKVMRWIGLEEPMVKTGLLPDRNVQREWDSGEITFILRYDEFPARYGAPHVILHRGDLQQILNSGLALGVLQLGKRLVGLEEGEGAVWLFFDDGSQAEADLVIGADGINSKVREILLGPERPTYTGHVAHRSIFSSSLLGGLTVADCTKWWGEDRYFMAYYLTPVRDEIYIVTGVPESWDSDDFTPEPTDVRTLRAGFEGFHPEVQRLIDACPEATTWPVLYRDPYPLWSRGRIVLLGDACHPMKPHMGQGAAMAIEDAAVLVRCIEHCGHESIAAASSLYESLRFDRTTRVKVESDKHEWMRYGSDCDWLFGYDALAVQPGPSSVGSSLAEPKVPIN